MKGISYFVAGSFNPDTGGIGQMWLVTFSHTDKFRCGQRITAGGKKYVLGMRDILDGGTVISYELIPITEVLEID